MIRLTWVEHRFALGGSCCGTWGGTASIEADQLFSVQCFYPRHAIRAVSAGDAAELIISFECLRVRFYHGWDDFGERSTSAGPAGWFDQLLAAANVPLAARKYGPGAPEDRHAVRL